MLLNLLDTCPKAWRSSSPEGWEQLLCHLPSVGEGKVRVARAAGPLGDVNNTAEQNVRPLESRALTQVSASDRVLVPIDPTQ